MNLLKAIGYTLWEWFVTLALFLAVALTFTFSLTWALEGMTHLFGENAIAVGALGVIGVCFIILFVMEVAEAYVEKFKED